MYQREIWKLRLASYLSFNISLHIHNSSLSSQHYTIAKKETKEIKPGFQGFFFYLLTHQSQKMFLKGRDPAKGIKSISQSFM